MFHPDQEHRVDFKIMVQQYLRFTRDLDRLKSQIKSKYHPAGLVHVSGTHVFTKMHRGSYLKQLPTNVWCSMMENLYKQMDTTEVLQKKHEPLWLN